MKTRPSLTRIIQSLAAAADGREDLMQEALLHWWQQERQNPLANRSWLLQSCRFRLQHLLRHERHLNGLNQAGAGYHSPTEADSLDPPEQAELRCEDCLFAGVCAREEIALLMKLMKPIQKLILLDMAEGLYIAEIARNRKFRHQVVSKHRQAIEKLALQIGIPRPFP